jgi:general secretion pathway protein G
MRGYTLIELMIAVAIVGSLAGLAVPAYVGFLEKARVTRTVAEIYILAQEIKEYFDTHDDVYPDSLAHIGRATLLDPWGFPYQYLKIAGNQTGGGGGHAQALPADSSSPSHWPLAWSWIEPDSVIAGGGNGGGGENGGSNADGGSGGGNDNGGGGSNVTGQARKDRFLVPINSDFDLYSVGPDGDSTPPLNAKNSRDDIIRANDGLFVGPASNF